MSTKAQLEEKLEKAVVLLEQALVDWDAVRFKEAGANIDSAHSLGDEVVSELSEESEEADDLNQILSSMEDLGEVGDWEEAATTDPDDNVATRSQIAEIKTNLEAFDLPEGGSDGE